MNKYLLFGISIYFLYSCGAKNQPLPILGEKFVQDGDTVFYRIPEFAFINQDSQHISNSTFRNKIYVADFFFTACPTICPKVKKQMLRINDRFDREDQVAFLSHSIDYRTDSVPRLKLYSDKLGIENPNWHFVQLAKDSIEYFANAYFNVAFEDETAPGGFDHSGRLILVDKDRHIRSYCDGTDEEDVDRFMVDMQKLLGEGL